MKYRKLAKYKYQLMETVRVKSCVSFGLHAQTDWIEVNGDMIAVQKGYCWDGASCAIDTHDFMVGSLVHDALYQLIRIGELNKKYRKNADIVLKHLCLEAGMPMWRANYVYWGVRLFGGKHLNLGVPQDIIHEVTVKLLNS